MTRTLLAGAEFASIQNRQIRRGVTRDRRPTRSPSTERCGLSRPMADGQPSPQALPWVGVEEVRQRAVEARATRERRAVTIVIGLVIKNSNDEALAARQGVDTELVVEPTWRRLGFDIADGMAISRGRGVARSTLARCRRDRARAGSSPAAEAP
jgi:hypothetical protein